MRSTKRPGRTHTQQIPEPADPWAHASTPPARPPSAAAAHWSLTEEDADAANRRLIHFPAEQQQEEEKKRAQRELGGGLEIVKTELIHQFINKLQLK